QTFTRGTITPILDASGQTIRRVEYRSMRVSQRASRSVPSFLEFLKHAWVTTGDVSPAGDLESIEDFIDWYLSTFGEARDVRSSSLLAAPHHDHTLFEANLCSIGGPVDHLLSRYALGYEKSRKIRDHALPYLFDLQSPPEPTPIDTPTRRSYQVTQWQLW